jgi:hypothetical protein
MNIGVVRRVHEDNAANKIMYLNEFIPEQNILDEFKSAIE